jgi:hypothetical protein
MAELEVVKDWKEAGGRAQCWTRLEAGRDLLIGNQVLIKQGVMGKATEGC